MSEKNGAWVPDTCIPACLSLTLPCRALCPRKNTAEGAADTITHILEYYFDGSTDIDIMREYMEGLIRTIMQQVVKVLPGTRLIIKLGPSWPGREPWHLTAAQPREPVGVIGPLMAWNTA